MMQVQEIVVDFLGKFLKLPFKGILAVLASTFILSVLLSMYLSTLVLPSIDKSQLDAPKGSFQLGRETASLKIEEIKSIIKRNIFNQTGEIPKEMFDIQDKAKHSADDVVRSELALKLNGTIFSGNPKDGVALIENTETKKQNSFMVGAIVVKNAMLAEVYQNKVILLVDGHKEYIELVEKAEKGRRTKKKGSIGGEGAKGGNLFDKFSEEGFERDGSKITMSADYRQKLLTGDFAKVLQDAKAEPVFENGELSGFRLTKIRSDSVYEKGGFHEDDVVKEINGISLVDTGQAIKLLNSLRGENEIEVGVVRGGKKSNIHIQVK